MDTFFDFLPALLVFWVVLRALRRQKGRRPQQRVGTGATATTEVKRAPGFTGFEELVRRLEAAAAEAARQNAGGSPAPPALTAAPPALEPVRDEESAFRSQDTAFDPAGEFHFVGAQDEGRQETEFHETHTLVHGAPPSSLMPSMDMPSAHLHDPSRPFAVTVHPLVARLRTLATAREALVLKDVLGPPRSRLR